MTIVPSPYQRDLFGALAAREDVQLDVRYLEAASPDSPWPEADLRPFERIVPGFWVPFGAARAHLNWPLPKLGGADIVVLSSFTSATGQALMRGRLRGKRWLFWGERLRGNTGWKGRVQHSLLAPLAGASGIVGIGRAAEADYRRRFPSLAHFCIPYYCDISNFLAIRRSGAAAPGSVTFLFCGQMIRRKGVDLLLLAFDRLVTEGLEVELLLVGREADLPEFLAAVSPTTRARVRYEGFQDPRDLPRYFAKGDVFVLPSRHDGWGVVINQALAAGLPVITSDAVGAGLDLVEQRENGMRVPAGNMEMLAAAMATLARDPVLVRRLGDNARVKAMDLTPEVGAERWVEIFESVARVPLPQ